MSGESDEHRAALEALPDSWERQRSGGPAACAAHASETKRRRKAERAARGRNRRRGGLRRCPLTAACSGRSVGPMAELGSLAGVLAVGGGLAALETMMASSDLAGDGVRVPS
jgi:hypothetical protein